jgi:hypothetical protein
VLSCEGLRSFPPLPLPGASRRMPAYIRGSSNSTAFPLSGSMSCAPSGLPSSALATAIWVLSRRPWIAHTAVSMWSSWLIICFMSSTWDRQDKGAPGVFSSRLNVFELRWVG